MIKLYNLDVREALKRIPDESVNCVITSPPYWALRDYGEGTESIFDGDENCNHDFSINERKLHSGTSSKEWEDDMSRGIRGKADWKTKDGFCSICGAWKGQLGLEPTFDLYIKHLCDIFEDIKRVLRKDGTCWVNIGDTYNSHSTGKRNIEEEKLRVQKKDNNSSSRYKAEGKVLSNDQTTGMQHRDIGPNGEVGMYNKTEFTGEYSDCGCNAGFSPGIVLDPFAGSGTTLKVARDLGRDSIGIEIKKEYCDIIKNRLFNGNEPLDKNEFEIIK